MPINPKQTDNLTSHNSAAKWSALSGPDTKLSGPVSNSAPGKGTYPQSTMPDDILGNNVPVPKGLSPDKPRKKQVVMDYGGGMGMPMPREVD
jgi:hypothetical protein